MGDNLSESAKPALGVIDIDALDLAIPRLRHQLTAPQCHFIPKREADYSFPNRQIVRRGQERLVGVIKTQKEAVA